MCPTIMLICRYSAEILASTCPLRTGLYRPGCSRLQYDCGLVDLDAMYRWSATCSKRSALPLPKTELCHVQGPLYLALRVPQVLPDNLAQTIVDPERIVRAGSRYGDTIRRMMRCNLQTPGTHVVEHGVVEQRLVAAIGIVVLPPPRREAPCSFQVPSHVVRVYAVYLAERDFAWASRFRRLVKDYERLPDVLAGLHFVAFACLSLRQATGVLGAGS
jgi:transposase